MPATPSGVNPVSAPAPPKKKSTHRLMMVIGTVIVGLLVLLLAVDRITPVVIGRQVGENLKSEMSTSERPDVSFSGFPFLTQLGAGRFGKVKIAAEDVPASKASKKLKVDKVDATLSDVKTSHGYSTMQIGSLHGSATVSYAKLSSYIGMQISAASDSDRIKVKLPSAVVVTGVPTVNKQDQTVGLEDPKFKIGDRQLPSNRFTSMLRGLFRQKVPDLNGLKLDDISARDDGLVVKGSGRNVTTHR